jgi:hypothetical protein
VDIMAELTPFDALIQISGGYCVPRCLHVVADLGVADALDDAPQTAAALAEATGANPDALGRVLRLLSAHGVFKSQDGLFGHTPGSRLLRTDHPQSMRGLVRMFGMPIFWASYEALEHSVRTGLPALDKVSPGGAWAYLAEHPDAARIFGEAMAAKAHGQIAGVVGAYDFAGFGLIGDIGGGRGHLLQAVLNAAPAAKGLLFDLPHMIRDASITPSGRLTLQAGDFFKDAMPTCDAYLMMEVIHDWGDEESVAILSAVRRAAPSHAKLLLIESIVPDDPGPHWSKMLDIHMLTLLTGRQRTRSEYAALAAAAGFRLEREINTASNVSILEAVPC